MRVYAGIDEAGYGPLFGPLVVSRSVFGLGDAPSDAAPPCLWERLNKAVCRERGRREGRIAVNDSKKLHQPGAAHGLRHLELGCLAFAGLAHHRPTDLGQWLDALGETSHRTVALPWYRPTDPWPWNAVPGSCDAGQVGIARSMLAHAATQAGVEVLDLGAAVVFEDRFNQMVEQTRSKAATSFTFVAQHLLHVWHHYGQHEPTVVVDHQSGRTRYREPLSIYFPEARMRVMEESPHLSSYRIEGREGTAHRAMTVHFLVEAEQHHLPVALASMIAKYTREMLMARFQHWFAQAAPQVKPTAGYASDGKRFWNDISMLLPALSIDPRQLRRMA